MKQLLSIKKPFQAVLFKPVSCAEELIPFDLFIFHRKICGAPPPISTLSEEQACSLSLHSAARNVGPEGECHLSVLWADYSGEELGEGK